MTREIKFRAWDKENKKMIDSSKDDKRDYDEYWGDVLGLKLVLIEEMSKDTRFEVMQYTGLKDKNGKEIYEGDIVAFPDTYTEKVDVGVGLVPVAQTEETAWGHVIMEREMLGLDINMDNETIGDGFSSFFEIDENIGLEELEIIGNIYENPDLIKK